MHAHTCFLVSTGSDRIIFEQLDISDSGSINAFAKRLGDKKSDFRILINNAGKQFFASSLRSFAASGRA